MGRIDVNKSKDKWEKRAGQAGAEWRDGFLGASGIADAAKSDEAQELYVQKMQDPDVLQKRQNRLANLTDEDFKRVVRQKGAALYTQGVIGKGEKWARNFGPIADAINTVVDGLPAKTTDPATNVTNRVLPVVLAAAEAAKAR